MKFSLNGLVVASIFAISASFANASTIVVNGDEWTLTDTGFTAAGAANVDRFVQNLVTEFGTNIHAYSNNFAYTGTSLANSMSNAGATFTTGTAITFDLPTLSTYDAIFLGGTLLTSAQETVLSSYVSGGGSIYLSAGTACGGTCTAAEEAAAWNDFLLQFDIQLDPVYGIGELTTPVSGDQIFNGVSQLYVNGANTLAVNGNVVCCGANTPLFAVVRTDVQVVPLPAGLPLMLGGLSLFAVLRIRRKVR